MIDYGLLTRIPLMNQAVGLPAGEEPVEVCCAGADLYYLSVEAWDRFAAIVQNAWTPANTSASAILHMFENEVVVPLTMKALKHSGLHEEELCWQKAGLGLGQPQWGRDNTSEACCWGGWNAKQDRRYAKDDLKIIRNNSCGHKLNFEDKASVRTYREIWNN